MTSFFKENLSDTSLGILLDAGCGDASFLDDLLSIAEASSVWGIDIDDNALSEARRYMNRLGISCHFRRSSSFQSGFPEGFFDNIAFQDLLHHLQGGNFSHYPNKSLREAVWRHLVAMDSLLRAGGHMIISEYAVNNHAPISRANRIELHNIKAETDSARGISHSYSMDFSALDEILRSFFSSRYYHCKASALDDANDDFLLPGRKDQALEKMLEYFDSYIASNLTLPGQDIIARRLGMRLSRLKESALYHGLLPQHRYMLIVQKPYN